LLFRRAWSNSISRGIAAASPHAEGTNRCHSFLLLRFLLLHAGFVACRSFYMHVLMHVPAPRNRRGIHALFGRQRHGHGTTMRPNTKATRPNRGAIIFYRALETVKAKPAGTLDSK
jgi:hypothetical protein